MVYLFIMVAVATVGIGSLWMQQRRQRAHIETVGAFQESLRKIAPESQPAAWRRRPPARQGRPGVRRGGRRPVPSDAARREAARRRVEARRRSRGRAAR